MKEEGRFFFFFCRIQKKKNKSFSFLIIITILFGAVVFHWRGMGKVHG